MPGLRPLLLRLAGAAVAAVALLPAAASAERVEVVNGLAGYTNGIAAGADGRLYVVEPGARSVAVLAPDGALVRRVGLPGPAGAATNAALGPDGLVWVALSTTDAARGFARIDPSGSQIPRSTASVFACGPAAMAVSSPNRMIYSAPDPTSSCGGSHGLGGVNADGSLQEGASPIDAYDLAFAAGKAYVPAIADDTVTRWAMQPVGYWGTKEATVTVPIGSGPDGIELGPGGQLYVTLYNSGQVARVDANQGNGTAATIVASGLVQPFGMATGSDGALYVASHDARLLRIAPDGGQRFIDLPPGFHPWQLARLGDDIWVTDNTAARVARVANAGRDEPAPPAPATTSAPAAIDQALRTDVLPATIAKPKVADVVSFASARRCLSKRSLTLTVRKPKAGAKKVASVKVTVGKGKARTYTAKRLKVPVKLTGLPKGTFAVKVVVTLSDKTKLTETRRYKTCAPKRR